jgi:hypothetical protein
MKPFIFLIFLSIILVRYEEGYSQKAVIFGEVFLITQRDTIKLPKARLELFKVTTTNPDQYIDDYYTDAKGRYIISDIAYGKYYFKVYYGDKAPLKFVNKQLKTNKGSVFSVDLELKGVPGIYVRK